MLRSIAKFLGPHQSPQKAEPEFSSPIETQAEPAHERSANFTMHIRSINADPYVCIADEALRLVSVFDDLKYDRADLDMVSGPMRRKILHKLQPLGFKQVSGSVIENRTQDIRFILPKFRALGASPFDATRDTSRREQDYFILTPTQAACEIINAYPVERAVECLEGFVIKHPINLLRIFDYLEGNSVHQAFKEAIGHLTIIQRKAVAEEPLKSRQALR